MKQGRAARLDSILCCGGMMGTEVVGHHDLSGAEGGGEDMADVADEAVAGQTAIEPHQRLDAVERERRDDGLILAWVAWGSRVSTLPARRSGMGRRVAQMAAGLVQEHQGVCC